MTITSFLQDKICCCCQKNPYQTLKGKNERGNGDVENQQTIQTTRRLLLENRNMSPSDNVVRYHLKEREEEFTEVKDYRLFCLTWNVNKKPPEVAELQKWLTCTQDNPEIYVIGFQELGLSMQACLSLGSKWEDTVRKSLPSGTDYVKVKEIRMWRIIMFVYVSNTIRHAIPSDLIDADSVATGIMGIMGNKGGVGVRMTLHNTSMCFINTHLAAHQEKNERRNQDFRDIENNMRFRQFLRPSDHDQIFWMGDLNYRIDGLTEEKVQSCVQANDLENLLPYDQLHQQIGITDVFRGYKEGKIKFHPTYKYKTDSINWHVSKQRLRIPSWCDRILYKGEGIEQVDYSSYLVNCVSDHKPVTSLFKIKVKVIDENKADGVLQEIKEKMNSFEE